MVVAADAVECAGCPAGQTPASPSSGMSETALQGHPVKSDRWHIGMGLAAASLL